MTTVVTDQESAVKRIEELKREFYSITDTIKAIASQYDVYVYLDIAGEYGTGASLYDGEWQASSMSC